MEFIEKTFDLKKFARAMHKWLGKPEEGLYADILMPNDLKPCLYDIYIQVLRNDSIDIGRLDFDEIGNGDIDDLESVLEQSPVNSLFGLGDFFRHLEPSAATRRSFI